MTLSELANYACDIVERNDDDTLSLAKRIAQRRFKLIWDRALWRESIMQSSISVDPTTNALHALGRVLLPGLIDKVLAVRTSDFELPPESVENYFRVSVDEFAASGNVVNFHLMQPVLYDFATSQSFLYLYTGASEVPTVRVGVHLDNAGASGVEITQVLSGDPSSNPTLTPTPSGAKITEVLWAGMDIEAGDAIQILQDDSLTEFARIHAGELEAQRRQRIRLMQMPTKAMTIRVLAKQLPTNLTGDGDVPQLQGVDECLLAFIQADLLEVDRQYGKRQTKLQEGMALLNGLLTNEMCVQPQAPRVIPEDSFGLGNPLTAKGYW